MKNPFYISFCIASWEKYPGQFKDKLKWAFILPVQGQAKVNIHPGSFEY